jgi:hypothetical protein
MQTAAEMNKEAERLAEASHYSLSNTYLFPSQNALPYIEGGSSTEKSAIGVENELRREQSLPERKVPE